jgi:hypothetical protein
MGTRNANFLSEVCLIRRNGDDAVVKIDVMANK